MKLRHYGLALIPICIAAFVFRAVELVLAVDPQTGYHQVGSPLPTVFNLFLALVTVFFVTLFFVVKRESKSPAVRLYASSAFDSVAGIAAAVLLTAAALFRCLELWFSDGKMTAKGFFTSADFWQAVLALLTAVFLIFFVTYPRRSAKRELWRAFSLAPVFFYVMRMVRAFVDPNTVFSKAFGIYQIVFYAVVAAAAMNFTKLLCGISCRRSYLFFTFEAGVFLSLRLAELVLRLIPGNPYNVSVDFLPFLGDLCFCLILFSMGRKLMRRRRKRAEEAAPQAAVSVESAEETPAPDLPAEEPAPQPEPSAAEKPQEDDYE